MAAGARSLAAIRTAATSSGTSAIRRTILIDEDRQEDQPGHEDGQQLPPSRGPARSASVGR